MRSVHEARRHARRHAGLIVLALGAALVLGAAPVAAQDEPATPADWLFIQADTVLGPTNVPGEERASAVCVQKNRFARNEEIVWRVKVFDPLSGAEMDESALASVQVVLPDQSFDMRFGPHPRDVPVDFFWTYGWDVPEDYPTGELPYRIVATAADGRQGTYEQFGVSLARLTITEEVRPVIEEAEG
jgi:hypothetical protein